MRNTEENDEVGMMNDERVARRPAPALSRHSSFSSAFTLAESLVASVVLAVAVVTVSGAIVCSQQQTMMQEEDSAAVMLARQLMEEIESTPLVLADGTTGQSGWPGVTDRSLYDTGGDFNGYTDIASVSVQRGSSSESVAVAGTATPTVSVVTPGTTPPALSPQQYRRSVSVSYPSSAFGVAVNSGDFAVVSVSVQGGSASANVKLSRLMTRTTMTR